MTVEVSVGVCVGSSVRVWVGVGVGVGVSVSVGDRVKVGVMDGVTEAIGVIADLVPGVSEIRTDPFMSATGVLLAGRLHETLATIQMNPTSRIGKLRL